VLLVSEVMLQCVTYVNRCQEVQADKDGEHAAHTRHQHTVMVLNVAVLVLEVTAVVLKCC
jgi:hypothetical protein